MRALSLLRLVFINLVRRGPRALLLAGNVALMVGSVFSAQVIETGVARGLNQGIDRLGADLLVVARGDAEETLRSVIKGQKSPALKTMSGELKEKIASLPGVQAVTSQLFLQSLTGASCCSAWAVFLIAFEPQTDFVVRPWLERHSARPLGPDDILVGSGITSQPGDSLMFYGHKFRVAGRLERSGLGLDMSVFIPMAGARAMIAQSAQKAEKPLFIDPDQVSAIMVRLVPEREGGPKPFKIAYEIERFYPETSVVKMDYIQQMTRRDVEAAVHLLRYAGLGGWVVSAVWSGMVFALAARERRREMGLLRALGATRRYVAGLVLGEGLIVFAAGGLAGLALAVALLDAFIGLIKAKLEVPFLWPAWSSLAREAALMFMLSVGTGLLAALAPTLSASRLEPYEAIRTAEM